MAKSWIPLTFSAATTTERFDVPAGVQLTGRWVNGAAINQVGGGDGVVDALLMIEDPERMEARGQAIGDLTARTPNDVAVLAILMPGNSGTPVANQWAAGNDLVPIKGQIKQAGRFFVRCTAYQPLTAVIWLEIES